MKLLKKAGAVLLALAMIAVMLPQMGNKVVKAAEPISHSITADSYKNLDTFFTAKPRSGATGGTTTQSTISDTAAKGYANALKTNSGFGYEFTLNSNEFAVLKILAHTRVKKNPTDFYVSSIANLGDYTGTELDRVNVAKAADANTAPDEYTFVALMTNGSYRIDTANEMALYKVQVDVYANQADAEAIIKAEQDKRAEKVVVDISGTITSDISLVGGKVEVKNTEGIVTASEAITKSGENTYNYVVKGVQGNLKYTVEYIDSQDIASALKLINKSELNKNEFTVEGTAYENANFTVNYYDLPANIWDFTNLTDWSTSESFGTIQDKTSIYKGLMIDATNGGKFATSVNNIQINKNTKVKIPVSGWGSVTCTFSTDKMTSATTLGETAGVSKAKTITYNYKNAEYVELSIGDEGLYLTKIEVVPDTNPAVKTIGASVRQEAAEWGNGIRFGGQLDLTKVDKATCTSGTLIGLAATVGDGNKMTLENVGTTCIDVVRTTFIEETDATLDYAAALINIPEANLDTSIVARPYVTVNGITYYGDQIATTYNNATKIVNEQ